MLQVLVPLQHLQQLCSEYSALPGSGSIRVCGRMRMGCGLWGCRRARADGQREGRGTGCPEGWSFRRRYARGSAKRLLCSAQQRGTQAGVSPGGSACDDTRSRRGSAGALAGGGGGGTSSLLSS